MLFSVSESEFLFTPNFKSISEKLLNYSKISLSIRAKILWVSYSAIFFSEIGMEFGVDANFHSVSFLSQQQHNVSISLKKTLTVSMLTGLKHIQGIKD